MAYVKLYGSLRQFGPISRFELRTPTIREALDWVCKENQKLHDSIFDDGHLKPYIRVMLNGRNIEFAQGLDTPLGDADEVAVFPPIGGG